MAFKHNLFFPTGGENLSFHRGFPVSESFSVRGDSTKPSFTNWADDHVYYDLAKGLVPYTVQETDFLIDSLLQFPTVRRVDGMMRLPYVPRGYLRPLSVDESFASVVLSNCALKYAVYTHGIHGVGIEEPHYDRFLPTGDNVGLPFCSNNGTDLLFDGDRFIAPLGLEWCQHSVDGRHVLVHLTVNEMDYHMILSARLFVRLFVPWWRGALLFRGEADPCVVSDAYPIFANANYCLMDEIPNAFSACDQYGPLPMTHTLGARFPMAFPESDVLIVSFTAGSVWYVAYPAKYKYSRRVPHRFVPRLPVEVVSLIDAYACGGGNTGYALSLCPANCNSLVCGCSGFSRCTKMAPIQGSLFNSLDLFYCDPYYTGSPVQKYVRLFSHSMFCFEKVVYNDFFLPKSYFTQWNDNRPPPQEWFFRHRAMEAEGNGVFMEEFSTVPVTSGFTPTPAIEFHYTGSVHVMFPVQASNGAGVPISPDDEPMAWEFHSPEEPSVVTTQFILPNYSLVNVFKLLKGKLLPRIIPFKGPLHVPSWRAPSVMCDWDHAYRLISKYGKVHTAGILENLRQTGWNFSVVDAKFAAIRVRDIEYLMDTYGKPSVLCAAALDEYNGSVEMAPYSFEDGESDEDDQ